MISVEKDGISEERIALEAIDANDPEENGF